MAHILRGMWMISSVARSADWISTTYNNQSAPGTFYTIGSEQSVPTPTPTPTETLTPTAHRITPTPP